MDDTLYLERDYVRSGFYAVDSYVINKTGVSGFGNQAWTHFEQGRRGDIFNFAINDCGLIDGKITVDELVEVYRAHVPQIKLLPDSLWLLESLGSERQSGLITDGPEISQSAKIKSLNLNGMIDHIVVTDARGKDWAKPSLKPFRHIEMLTGDSGSACIYIADNPRKDFIAPKELGWRTLMVDRPGSLYSSLTEFDQAELKTRDLSKESLRAVGLEFS